MARERLLSAEDVQARVCALAQAVAQRIDDDTVCVCLLTGALWFAGDVMRGLALAGCNPRFDCLWLASYGDAEVSSGRVRVHAPLQKPLNGARVLLLDDVLDSGLSLVTAREMMLEAGASEVLTAVFARKPWPTPRDVDADFVAWEAPARYIIGYGMDAAGRFRGLPDIWAKDAV
jgi:hypoxanthine phosphoribosyltransferase